MTSSPFFGILSPHSTPRRPLQSSSLLDFRLNAYSHQRPRGDDSVRGCAWFVCVVVADRGGVQGPEIRGAFSPPAEQKTKRGQDPDPRSVAVYDVVRVTEASAIWGGKAVSLQSITSADGGRGVGAGTAVLHRGNARGIHAKMHARDDEEPDARSQCSP